MRLQKSAFRLPTTFRANINSLSIHILNILTVVVKYNELPHHHEVVSDSSGDLHSSYSKPMKALWVVNPHFSANPLESKSPLMISVTLNSYQLYQIIIHRAPTPPLSSLPQIVRGVVHSSINLMQNDWTVNLITFFMRTP